jgi:hypothetical protein
MAHRRDGKIWIDGLETQFTGQSLSSLDLLEAEREHPAIAVLPDLQDHSRTARGQVQRIAATEAASGARHDGHAVIEADG